VTTELKSLKWHWRQSAGDTCWQFKLPTLTDHRSEAVYI